MRSNLTAEMGRRRLTKKALANLLCVSQPTINKYIDGKSIPSDKLQRIAELFNTSTDYILENTQ